jgi:hypothetical protein
MILGISGRKQSGKTTTGNFIISLKLAELEISNKIDIDNQGRIVISDLFGDTNYSGILDVSVRKNDFMLNKLYEMLDPYIKIYSFADPLKQDICMNMLGLTYDQCYGSDEAKNSLTEIMWENIPGLNSDNIGPMTAREVMEVVGTDIFRNIKQSVWVETTLRKIEKEKSQLAIIVDCRFPNEISSIIEANGKVIRLTRNPFGSNAAAEKALDKEVYDWSKFNYVCQNDNMTIYDQCMDIQKFLQETELL